MAPAEGRRDGIFTGAGGAGGGARAMTASLDTTLVATRRFLRKELSLLRMRKRRKAPAPQRRHSPETAPMIVYMALLLPPSIVACDEPGPLKVEAVEDAPDAPAVLAVELAAIAAACGGGGLGGGLGGELGRLGGELGGGLGGGLGGL
eukprot:CAMPEP_0180063016 /NCGR_PEP_ID=MMETSP0985-20121206/7413_1 /TAXON_ID=483367 /ORGANISM="non described non described, Strain CCMP 2436" /LENGTH=147 /DNA_ID=CAMNT_0021993203 /DNA_START=461 /DNA_END=900 /DNA_ORIENTATION=+